MLLPAGIIRAFEICRKTPIFKIDQQIENAPDRSRRIDKSAGNTWDLSIPSELLGELSIY